MPLNIYGVPTSGLHGEHEERRGETADTKKSKHYKPKVLARQRNNYRYGNALGYAEEYGYGPRGPFFQ